MRAQCVGDQQLRDEALLLEQLMHQPQGGPGIASVLNQHVENLALMVDRTPEVHPLAGNPDYQASGVGQLHPRALSEPDVRWWCWIVRPWRAMSQNAASVRGGL